MNDEERERLVEELAGAYRAADPRGLPIHPAFLDLDEQGRIEAFERARQSRELEAALDPEGLSTTARAVLAKIRSGG